MHWVKPITKGEVLKTFEEFGPMHGLVANAKPCLGWFVSQVFCNRQGKPLKLLPFQMVMLNMLWYKKFPMILACRGAGKTFMLGLYCLLRAMLVPGSKIVICGAGYRQAKLVFKYIQELYEQSPVIQESLKGWGGPKYGSDAATFKVGLSEITAIPIGDGDKIRGLRATVLIADEFGAIPEETFEIVLSPFTSVHANPAQRAAIARFVKRLQELKAHPALIELAQNTQDFGNQIVISGTATYKYNHFYKRFKTYKMFIDTQGNKEEIKKAIEERSLATAGKMAAVSTDDVTRMAKMWVHYAVMQLPYTALPEGFLDEDTIRSNKASFSSYRFMQEYMAQFPDDSDGFIKRSSIESATPHAPNETPVIIELYGDPRAVYVAGIDPARWNDNLGIVILKLSSRGKEVVYCDAWNKKEYAESAKRIREICQRFNVQYIAMDKGGGGDAITEWLCKKQDGIKPDELIWPIPDQLEKTSDLGAPGKKIIDLVNFAGNWSPEAAHGLEAAINHRNLLFPSTDGASDTQTIRQYLRYYNLQNINEAEKQRLSVELWGMDDWEAQEVGGEPVVGIFNNINECINETCAIMKETTEGGTERFILPRLADQPEGLDMRRRDRFSALMLANYAAKCFQGHGNTPPNNVGLSTSSKRSLTGRKHRRRGSVAF